MTKKCHIRVAKCVKLSFSQQTKVFIGDRENILSLWRNLAEEQAIMRDQNHKKFHITHMSRITLSLGLRVASWPCNQQKVTIEFWTPLIIKSQKFKINLQEQKFPQIEFFSGTYHSPAWRRDEVLLTVWFCWGWVWYMTRKVRWGFS